MNDLQPIIDRNGASLRKGAVEYAVMLQCRQPRYVAEIVAGLAAAGLPIVEGTLYPLLSRLSKQGLVSYEWQESEQGPPRKYYHLTTEGKAVLKAYDSQWHDLTTSINKLIEQGENNE